MNEERNLLENYVKAREEVEHTKELLKKANSNLTKHERVLREYMETNGIESTAKYEDLGRLSLGDPVVSVKFDKDNFPFDQAVSWCKENGFSQAVKETIHHSTLGALVRSVIDEGKEIPECFIINTFRPTSYRKA